MLLLTRGQVIKDDVQLRKILMTGYVHSAGGTGTTSGVASGLMKLSVKNRDPSMPAFHRIRNLRGDLQFLHNSLLEERSTQITGFVHEMANAIKDLAEEHVDEALASLQLDVYEDLFASRQLHAGLVCYLLARASGLSMEERISITSAALTYDVALGPLQIQFNKQLGPLTPAQRTLMQQHPEQATHFLRSAGVKDEIWLDAVLHHHERPDGKGYPAKLTGENLKLGARILGLADVFCTIIRPRAYRDATHCSKVLRDLYMERDKQVDGQLIMQLIKCIGINPPGSFVRLKNNEIAVVTAHGDNAACPQVCAIVSSEGKMMPFPDRRSTDADDLKVVEAVPLGKYRGALKMVENLWVSSK